MADNYSIDDILAELDSKKSGSKPYSAPSFSEKPKPAPQKKAQKNDFIAYESFAPPEKKAAPQMDKTLIMDSIRPTADSELDQRRQQQVRSFMEKREDETHQPARSAFVEDDDDDEYDEDRASDISRFFGGLKSGKKSAKPERATTHHKQAKPQHSKTQRTAAKINDEDEQEHPRHSKKHGGNNHVKAVAGEFVDPAHAKDFRRKLLTIQKKLSSKLLALGVITFTSLYLSLCNLFPLPLLNPVCPEIDMRAYLITNFVVMLIGVCLSIDVIISGAKGFFTLNSNNNSPAAICVLGVFAHSIALIINPSAIVTGESSIFFFIALLSLLFNTIGKRMAIVRTEKNFTVLTSTEEKMTEVILKDKELSKALAQGQGLSDPEVICSAHSDFPKGFLTLSQDNQKGAGLTRFLCPIFTVFAIILALVCRFLFDQTAMYSLAVFAAVLCIASPLTATIVENLPLLRASSTLAKKGAFIGGHSALEKFEESNCICVDPTELYRPHDAQILAIKPLVEERFGEAIYFAASIMNITGGVLKDAILEAVAEKYTLLHEIDNITLDNGGISAVIKGETIIIGSREYMESFGIAIPSKDYEESLFKSKRKTVYISASSVPIAVMAVRYRVNPNLDNCLAMLAKKEYSLIVKAGDPVITESKIASDYNYPKEFINIISAQEHHQLEKEIVATTGGLAHIVSLKHSAMRLRALGALASIKHSMFLGNALQVVALMLSYVFVSFISFKGNLGGIGFLQLAALQLFFTLLVMIIPNTKKF